MIEYALLCQTITDWRAGRRPVLPPSSTPTLGGSGAAARAAAGAPEDDDAEVLEAGDADLEDEVGYPEGEVVGDTEVPLDDGYSDAEAPAGPPDIDSTMVYGSGGAMPGQWPAEGTDDDGAPLEPSDGDEPRS